MATIFVAVAPVFIIILLGVIARKTEIVPRTFWDSAERLVYFGFFPAMLLHRTATADIAGMKILPIVGTIAGAIVVVAGLTLALRRPLCRILGIGGPGFGAFFQGGIRPNVYVAFGIGAALWHQAGVVLVSLCIVASVPLVNLLSVAVLQRYCTKDADIRWRRVVVPVLKNPLILACLLGGTLNLLGIGLPPVIEPTLDLLGRPALPLALLSVGVGLDLAAVRAAKGAVLLATTIKLAALPGLTAVAAVALGLQGSSAEMVVLYAGVPLSASTYVLTRQMGGDEKLVAGIITLSTLASMITLPIILLLVR